MPTVEEILMIKGPDVVVAPSTTTVLEAAGLMAENNVGSVIVSDDGQVLGIFTERDLLQRVVAAGKDPASVLLGDVMSSPAKTCCFGTDLQKCAQELAGGHIRHLVVIEDGALVGLIGLRDILDAELESSQEQIRALRSAAGNGRPATNDGDG